MAAVDIAVVVVVVRNLVILIGLFPETAKQMIAEKGTHKHLAHGGTRLVQQFLLLWASSLEAPRVVDWDLPLF